jgi:hypothetical protein
VANERLPNKRHTPIFHQLPTSVECSEIDCIRRLDFLLTVNNQNAKLNLPKSSEMICKIIILLLARRRKIESFLWQKNEKNDRDHKIGPWLADFMEKKQFPAFVKC